MSSYLYPLITASLAVFVSYSGYCVYKYSKQHVVNSCKYSLFESRLVEILQREASKSSNYLQICELPTPVARRDFFMKKIKAANACISSGDYDTSVSLLIEAMAVCSRPAALLHCMSNTLPMVVYRRLLEKLSSLT